MIALHSPLVMKTGAGDWGEPRLIMVDVDGRCAREEADSVVEGEDLAGVAGNPVDKPVPRLALVYPLISAFEPVEQHMIYAPALRRRGGSRWARLSNTVLPSAGEFTICVRFRNPLTQDVLFLTKCGSVRFAGPSEARLQRAQPVGTD